MQLFPVKKGLALYGKYKDADPVAAHDIIRNLFCRFPGNRDCFEAYFSLCFENAEKGDDFEARANWLQEADYALGIFVEKVRYTEDVMALVNQCRSKLNEFDLSEFAQKEVQQEETPDETEGQTKLEDTPAFRLFHESVLKDRDFSVLIAKNIFLGDPGDESRFSFFFDHCLNLALEHSGTDDGWEGYFEKAGVALQLFGEKILIDKDSYAFLVQKQERLEAVKKEIENKIREKRKASEDIDHIMYKEALETMDGLVNEVSNASSQEKLDEILQRLSKMETMLDKDSLDPYELSKYERLTKKLSEDLPRKIESLKKKRDAEYNFSALNTIKRSFDRFIEDEKKYKSLDEHFRDEIAAKLFSLDMTRLFPEVYSYYNYVYGYMFGKMSDENKFKLTLLALQQQSASNVSK